MGYGPWTTGRGRLLLILLALTVRADGAELGWTDVTVRVYHDGVVTEADEARALKTAGGILTAADVNLHWTHCHAGTPFDGACARPLAPDELALRLTRVRRPAAQTRALALGEALLPGPGTAPAFAQLYLERVDDLARRSGADAAVLLGRAIAHELTHLLTGDGRHPRTGLMRSIWSAGDLTRNQSVDWMLDPGNVAAIRARTWASMTMASR
jgi:hypothetical protein